MNTVMMGTDEGLGSGCEKKPGKFTAICQIVGAESWKLQTFFLDCYIGILSSSRKVPYSQISPNVYQKALIHCLHIFLVFATKTSKVKYSLSLQMLMSSPANLNLQPAPSSSATPTGTPAHSQADLHFFVAHGIKNQIFFYNLLH